VLTKFKTDSLLGIEAIPVDVEVDLSASPLNQRTSGKPVPSTLPLCKSNDLQVCNARRFRTTIALEQNVPWPLRTVSPE